MYTKYTYICIYMRKTGNIYVYTQRNLLKKGIQIRKLHIIKGISLEW